MIHILRSWQSKVCLGGIFPTKWKCRAFVRGGSPRSLVHQKREREYKRKSISPEAAEGPKICVWVGGRPLQIDCIVPLSQERCAMCESLAQLSSSYVLNLVIFYPFLLQHTQKTIKLHTFLKKLSKRILTRLAVCLEVSITSF